MCEFGVEGVARVLQQHEGSCETVGDALLSALHAHVQCDALTHDDVTFFLGQFVDGPAGPALWHVMRNRVIRPLLGR